jgi:hypothetical protein
LIGYDPEKIDSPGETGKIELFFKIACLSREMIAEYGLSL